MTFARRSAPDAPRSPGPIRRFFAWIGSPVGVALLAASSLGSIVAAISYSHMLDWAKANGDTGPDEWRAYLFPLSVDGAIVAASAVIYADVRAGRKADKLAYFVAVVGMLWSIVANVAHDVTGWLAAKAIAGWPAIALAVVVELVFRFVRRMREQADSLAAAEREAAERAEAARVEAERIAAEAARIAEEAAIRKAEAEQRRRERAEQREREKVEQREEPEAEVIQLRTTGTGGVERPTWLIEGATAEQAMRSYLANVDNEANGAELDREVGRPYFGTSDGYGRKVARTWREEQQQNQGQQKEV